MIKLNSELLSAVKRGFVPQPGGQGEPVAGASQMTAGMGAPVGGDPNAAAGGDPNAAAMGGDPSMMGGGVSGLDPAMAGQVGGAAAPQGGMSGTSTITITIDDLIKLFKVFQKNTPGAAPAAAAPAAAAPTSDPRVDQMWQMMQSVMGQQGGGGEG